MKPQIPTPESRLSNFDRSNLTRIRQIPFASSPFLKILFHHYLVTFSELPVLPHIATMDEGFPHFTPQPCFFLESCLRLPLQGIYVAFDRSLAFGPPPPSGRFPFHNPQLPQALTFLRKVYIRMSVVLIITRTRSSCGCVCSCSPVL